MTQSDINSFVELVLANLRKNGFPENSVSFPLDRMYEEADKRGFSFNKIRDLLREQGVDSELTDERVVFSTSLPAEDSVDPDQMMEAVQQMLGQMSPEQQAQLIEMVQNMDPNMIENIRRQWEAMSTDEQSGLMDQMKRIKPT